MDQIYVAHVIILIATLIALIRLRTKCVRLQNSVIQSVELLKIHVSQKVVRRNRHSAHRLQIHPEEISSLTL